MPARPNSLMSYSSTFLSMVLLILTFAPVLARADVKYPTKDDLQGFKDVCSGGSVYEVNGQLDAALEAWRLKPGAQGNLRVTIKDLGAIMEKIKDGRDGQLFQAYLDCVQNLILSYLHANSTSTSQTSSKPRT